jgi:hypothetical protein
MDRVMRSAVYDSLFLTPAGKDLVLRAYINKQISLFICMLKRKVTRD